LLQYSKYLHAVDLETLLVDIIIIINYYYYNYYYY